MKASSRRDRGGERQRQPRAQVLRARVEHRDEHDRERLEHERRPRERVWQRAVQVPPRDPRRHDDVRVVEPEPVGDEQKGRAEALHLQPAVRLRAEAGHHAVRVVGGERDHHQRGDGDEGAESERRTPRAGAAPDVDAREGDERERVDLRRDREPERCEAEQVAAAQEEQQPEHREQRGPGVVGVERDRAERSRRQREQAHCNVQLPPRGADLHQHERREEDRRDPAERHQRLERGVVVPRAERGRRHEDRKRSRRVLDEDVAVRQLPVQELLRVALVDVHVPKPRGTEEPAVGDRAGGDEDGHGNERSTQRVPHARRLEARLHAATAAVQAVAARAAAPEEAGAG